MEVPAAGQYGWRAGSRLLGLPEDLRDLLDLAEQLVGGCRIDRALRAARPRQLGRLVEKLVQVRVLHEVGRLEVIGPEHPEVVLEQFGALLLDDPGPGTELRVGVGLVLFTDRLDRLRLNPGLCRDVDAARQVAVGMYDGPRGQYAWQSHQDPPVDAAMIALVENPTPGWRTGRSGPAVHRTCPGALDGAHVAGRGRRTGAADRAGTGRSGRGGAPARGTGVVGQTGGPAGRGRLVGGGRQPVRLNGLAGDGAGRGGRAGTAAVVAPAVPGTGPALSRTMLVRYSGDPRRKRKGTTLGSLVMSVDPVFELHKAGKMAVIPTVPLATREDLSLA